MANPGEVEKLERRWLENMQGLSFAPLAEAYRKAGRFDEAFTALEIGLGNHPDYLPAHVVRGRCLLDVGNDAEAALAFTHVLDQDPDHRIALRSLADLREREGDLSEAVRHLEHILVLDRSDEDVARQLDRLRQEITSRAAATAPAREPAPAAEWDMLPAGETVAPDAGAVAVAAGEISSEPHVLESPTPAPPPLGAILEEAEATGVVGSFTPVDLSPSGSTEFALPNDSEALASVAKSEPEPLALDEIAEEALGLERSEWTSLSETEAADIRPVEGIGFEEDMRFEPPVVLPPVDLPPVEAAPASLAASDPASDLTGSDLDLISAGSQAIASESDAPASAPVHVPAETPEPVADVAEESSLCAPEDAPPAFEDAPPVFDDGPPAPGDEPDAVRAETAPEIAEATAEEEPAPDDAPLVVTESMAEVFLRQGYAELALAVYTQLAKRDPENLRLQEAICHLAPPEPAPADPPAAPDTGACFHVARTGGESVTRFLQRVLGARERAAPTAVVPPAMERPASGEPTRPSRTSFSLEAVFGEENRGDAAPGAAAPPADGEGTQEGQSPSFDEFFGETSGVRAAPTVGSPSVGGGEGDERESEADLRQFNDWLKGLKR